MSTTEASHLSLKESGYYSFYIEKQLSKIVFVSGRTTEVRGKQADFKDITLEMPLPARTCNCVTQFLVLPLGRRNYNGRAITSGWEHCRTWGLVYSLP